MPHLEVLVETLISHYYRITSRTVLEAPNIREFGRQMYILTILCQGDFTALGSPIQVSVVSSSLWTFFTNSLNSLESNQSKLKLLQVWREKKHLENIHFKSYLARKTLRSYACSLRRRQPESCCFLVVLSTQFLAASHIWEQNHISSKIWMIQKHISSSTLLKIHFPRS